MPGLLRSTKAVTRLTEQLVAVPNHLADDEHRRAASTPPFEPGRRSSPRSPTRTRWPGSVPDSITAAGVSGDMPLSLELRGDLRDVPHAPCRTPRRASAARASQSSVQSGESGSWWPVTSATACPASRCVSGMPAAAHAPTAEVTPGTISNGTPASAEHFGLLAAAAEHARVAALQPAHAFPSRAKRTSASLIVSCRVEPTQ